MDLKSLDFKVGSSNPSGISDTIFYAPKSDIQVWPEIMDELEDATEDADLDKDDYVDYDGNFTMVTGKKFRSLYNTQGKGKVSSSTIGEVDCKMNQNTLEIKFPRLTREARGFAKAAASTGLASLHEWFGSFDFSLFTTDIYYVYMPGGMGEIKWLYLAVGIVASLGIAKITDTIKCRLKK